MENETSCKEADDEELVLLLRALRVEAVPEAQFEERFLYEFRERLAHEMVSRPARVLLWEHILHLLSNIGRRRLLWGASSLGAGVLCLGALMLQHRNPAGHSVAAYHYQVQSIMPITSSAEDVVRTSVRPRVTRKNYTERLLASRSADTSSYWSLTGVEDDLERPGLISLPTSLRGISELDAAGSDLMLHIAH